MTLPPISRRNFLVSASLATAGLALRSPAYGTVMLPPLEEVGYGDVTLSSAIHIAQFENTHSVLMGLSDDALLKPFRAMVGQSAPGEDLGGWYTFNPHYDPNAVTTGFAPTATFGQWVSALARAYAIHGDPKVQARVLRLNRLYAQTISPKFYGLENRFPAYCYDKLVCGLIDAHQYVGDRDAFRILDETTKTARPLLPGHAVEHGTVWRSIPDEGYTWDESYTMPENLFLAYQRGAGKQYRELGVQYLDDAYFGPLSEGRSDLAGRHAYSHVNALSSAMQAYLTLGSEKHLRAAKNGFDFVLAQSYATGGWGPDEQLRPPNSADIAASLTNTHHTFETPCGAYGHFKVTRYLLRVTRDSRYGDSMERVMYNTILGAKPLQPDGSAFYYSDYNFKGSKFYHDARWPCCSGTITQIATDYGISSYFRDDRGVYVNLYVPSTLRWRKNTLTIKTEYPFESAISIEVATPTAQEFEVHLRIPEWAEGARIAVNGKEDSGPVQPGHFATIRRTWKNGDRIELELPLKNRLEPLDSSNPEVVALMNGPLVLFAIGEGASLGKGDLLAARKNGSRAWQAGNVKFQPWTEIHDETYSTYQKIKV
jgi:DUF1680 family protein